MYLLGKLAVQGSFTVFRINSANQGIQGDVQQPCIINKDTQGHCSTVILHVADVARSYIQGFGNFCWVSFILIRSSFIRDPKFS